MSKYYAVKHGRKNGVYKTWAECQEQTKGFSDAVFKSFTSEQEALDYISPPIEKKEVSIVKENVIEIYTDGSHQRSIKYLGIGAWCCYKNKEYSLSATCDADLLESYDITEDKCSNPTAEFIAFAEVLKYFKKADLPAHIGIIFYIDYIGVKHWIEGNWKAEKDYIRKIRDTCLKIMKKIKNPIQIVHVKAHSCVLGNECADVLAKCLDSFSNFDELILAIKE